MKKNPLLNLGSFLLLSLSFLLWNGVRFVSAQESGVDEACDGYKYNKDQLFEDIFEAASVNSNFQVADMFGGNPEKPEVKNAYLNVYKMLDQSPADEALENTASAYQYTQTEMCGILGGSLAPLADNSTSTLSVTDVQEIRSDILTAYQAELERTTREQEMFLDSYGKEIFANGDTSDSSFDVLYDLDILEYLLFGEDSYTTTGGGSLSTSSDDEGASADDATAAESDSETGSTSSETGAVDADTGSDPADAETIDSGSAASADVEGETTDSTVNPAACAADDALQAALVSYLDSSGGAGSGTSDDSNGSDTSDDSDDFGADADSADESGVTGEADESDDGLLLAAEPHDWTQPEICDGIFCLFINFKNRDDTAYAPSDNCIQCHLDYILETMEKTTSKALTPGKVSGNMMEPSICKEDLAASLVKVDLNFTAIAMPIATPPGDDIVTNVDFCQEMQDFTEDDENYDLLMHGIFKDLCGEGAQVPDALTSEQQEQLRRFGQGLNDQIKAAETRSDSSATVDEIFAEAFAAHQADLDAVRNAFRQSYITAHFEDQATFFKRMEYEMDQMTAYFQVFYDMIAATQKTAEEMQNRLAKAK